MRKFAFVALLALMSAGIMFGASHLLQKKRVASNTAVDVAFNSWLSIRNKMYSSPAELNYRKSVFATNYANVEQMNKVMSHESELNLFADMTTEEFVAKYTGLNQQNSNDDLSNIVYLKESNGADIDWRKKGAVNSVKNQNQCGSCWAFSATSAVESAWEIKHGQLLDLSEQQLVDCSGGQGNMGCSGGWPQWAFAYIIQAGGQMAQKDYPYTGRDGKCGFKASAVKAKISSWSQVPTNSCSQLEAAVDKNPVSVALNASGMMLYKSGIYADPNCATSMNHAVMADGVGTEGGKRFWIVRNSWGTGWGEAGYIRMAVNVGGANGICGICQKAAYPVSA